MISKAKKICKAVQSTMGLIIVPNQESSGQILYYCYFRETQPASVETKGRMTNIYKKYLTSLLDMFFFFSIQCYF